ncbi:unnamed protein product [Nezara viridula]|uniref:Uncharacterized protein n=1 Tax=Nezara viridula TaxID=85310 RepID=A0A9P0EC65_NEZVI|nr:unnamed protein product [Nezara viridula]
MMIHRQGPKQWGNTMERLSRCNREQHHDQLALHYLGQSPIAKTSLSVHSRIPPTGAKLARSTDITPHIHQLDISIMEGSGCKYGEGGRTQTIIPISNYGSLDVLKLSISFDI